MINRVFVEKKIGYNVAEIKLANDIRTVLGVDVADVKMYIRYDVEGATSEVMAKARGIIFSENPVDNIYDDVMPKLDGYRPLVVEFLPGQYDQRADSCMQCVQLLTMQDRPIVRCATVYAIKGVSDSEFDKIRGYIINPVESREGSEAIPATLHQETLPVGDVPMINGFSKMSDSDVANYHATVGFAMSLQDLIFVREYFASEDRDPSETELKVIDTYWSDHCRHTTFATEITSVKINSNNPHIAKALDTYNELFTKFNGKRADKYKCLMDIATISVKMLKHEGLLDNLDTSDEINACSIVVNVDVDGVDEEWLIMFKNETHNHPTEIEPFGGAATCLGGAIRDPLSGRTYVYQAMRVTGSGDPRVSFSDTLKGKLPQRVITKTAASGYSSYGNQIGLATGLVSEMYHENYRAKRLETGFVVAGAPRENIVRRKPVEGDVIVLVGGETGRDGCGGATGSSKAHTEKSVEICGAEVQKGNPPTERKIQRLFRSKEACNLIVKCNDFGAGGVSVAIGELADSLDINLDLVPKKYDGLTGTEIAISESQERMAVVLAPESVDAFVELARSENLVAKIVANVTDNGRMRMIFKDKIIVDLKRDFLDTNGVKQCQDIIINDDTTSYMDKVDNSVSDMIASSDYVGALLSELGRLNVCSTKGLGEIFDSTIGASTIIMPFGGKTQLTPSIVMATKPPVNGVTDTATVSSYACSPQLMESSPFTGAIYSVVGSISKLIASGVKRDTIRLTLQEFFKKLGKDAERWGEPLSALLGALTAQLGTECGAIGGKDSMSGSFENLDVPPTLICFAVGITKASKLIHNTFSYTEGAKLYTVMLPQDSNNIPDFAKLNVAYDSLSQAIECGDVKYATVIEEGGAISAIAKSCVGNKIGFDIPNVTADMYMPHFGSFVVVASDVSKLKHFDIVEVGAINQTETANIGGKAVKMNAIINAFTNTLEQVFPTTATAEGEANNLINCAIKKVRTLPSIIKPKVLIPVFPGTNCEYDTARAFDRAGGNAEIFVIRNQTSADLEDSIKGLIKSIESSQIIAFPGGFSGGDEPDGSGKFIATTFKNEAISSAVMELLYKRDGLAIGICNGFQALIKLGLVPYGDIREQIDTAPTLTFNNITRHVSTIAQIRVATNKSPWLCGCRVNDVFNVPVSHGEGRFVASPDELDRLIKAGQVATQYVEPLTGNATMTSPFNPNGSMFGIEGIISPDGRVLGKMGHAERIDANLYKNVEGNYDMKLFESGIKYFK